MESTGLENYIVTTALSLEDMPHLHTMSSQCQAYNYVVSAMKHAMTLLDVSTCTYHEVSMSTCI